MTTRAARAVHPGPVSEAICGSEALVSLILSLAFVLGTVGVGFGQPAEQEASRDITVPAHWSRYQAPTSYPEGTTLHIIVRGDTLWDLSNQYLQNPFLWPQLWDANRYIENPHLIYPGDPLRIPEVDVVRPEGVEPGGPGTGPGGAPGGPGTGPGAGGPGGVGSGPRGPAFFPATEEIGIQCANYVDNNENRDLRIFGSEEGSAKDNLSTNDIVYLNRGSRDGVNPGDKYYTQRRVTGWGNDYRYVERSGWLTVIAVQEETSIAHIDQACRSIWVGDYLKPFEPIPVPLLPNQPTATRLTPETGQMRGRIVAALENQVTLGEGYMVSIDLGEEDGVVPGNLFTIFRYVYDNAPRKVLGELAILTVQRRNATAKIMDSYDIIDIGDLVELK